MTLPNTHNSISPLSVLYELPIMARQRSSPFIRISNADNRGCCVAIAAKVAEQSSRKWVGGRGKRTAYWPAWSSLPWKPNRLLCGRNSTVRANLQRTRILAFIPKTKRENFSTQVVKINFRPRKTKEWRYMGLTKEEHSRIDQFSLLLHSNVQISLLQS